MTRIYAAVTDLPEAYRTDPLAEPLILHASALVTNAIASARFATDEDGMPTGDDLLAARAAVVSQVSTWLSTGVNPITGHAAKPAVVASKSTNGSSVSYAADGSRDAFLAMLADGTSLTHAASAHLEAQGLLTTWLVGYPARPRPFLGGPMFVGGQ